MAWGKLNIKEIMIGISNNEFLLPVIQREIVWKCDQIENLFDSILSGFPINSMLFWKYRVNNHEQDSYKFYEFIKVYDEYVQNHNQEYNIAGTKEITAVLDGQQRLTALYLGLKGYMNLKKPYYKANKADNYDKKFLYINLLYDKKLCNNSEDISNEHEFKFKTEAEAKEDIKSKKGLWYKIGRILNYDKNSDLSEITNDLEEWDGLDTWQQEKVRNIFYRLVRIFLDSEDVINFYLETDQSLDKALKIFVRINAGGTPLDYTDFLMSMIVNNWLDAREEINKAIDNINCDFNFNLPKDIFLRACLYLSDEKLNFNANNFKNSSILKIKYNFDNIVKYMRLSCSLFNCLGYCKDNLRSNLILLPVAQFLMQNDIKKIDDIDYNNLILIKYWIQLSILGRVFGAQTISYLTMLRNEIKGQKEFPLDRIKISSSKLGRSLSFDEMTLIEIIDKAKYSTQQSWALLTLLYPYNDYRGETFHEDHIYPQSRMSKEQKDEGGNYIANLQLLKGKLNVEKGQKMPEIWIQEHCKNCNISVSDYKKDNYIPLDIEINEKNFNRYIEMRKHLILEQLKKILNIKP